MSGKAFLHYRGRNGRNRPSKVEDTVALGLPTGVNRVKDSTSVPLQAAERGQEYLTPVLGGLALDWAKSG